MYTSASKEGEEVVYFFCVWIFGIKIDAIIHALRKEHSSIHKEKWEVEPGLPSHEVEKAESSSKNAEESGSKN